MPPGKPGFFAPDVRTALRERAEWFEGLGASAVLDSEDFDSGSEQWDGEHKDVPTIEVAAPEAKASVAGSLVDLLAANFARVEAEELNVKAAREHFSKADQEPAMVLRGRPEPPAARLKRLNREVKTLCDWAAERQEMSTDEGEMQRISREVDSLGDRLRAQELSSVQCMWLPPESEEVTAMAQLLRHSRQASGTGAEPTAYSFQASTGWLLKSQAELLPKLQARLETLSSMLGAPEADGSLSAQTQNLSHRLQRLENLGGEAALQLQSSTALLASQIDQAVSEAQVLEALAAEQEKEESELSKPVSPTSKALALEVESAVETVDTQVYRLYDQLASLDQVAIRAREMEEQLGQDAWLRHLELFVQDLRLAEARSLKASELLTITAQTARSMKDSLQVCSKQLQRDVEKLQAKLARLS